MNSSLKCKEMVIEINEQKPFQNDKLNREPFANVLTHIIDTYSDTGCVLSLNGEWGSGKTTFVKMWQKSLQNKGYRTLYFNAWKNDYLEDPLIAILGELKEDFHKNENFNNVITYGGKIILKMAEAYILKKIGINSKELSAAISEISNICEKSIDSYNEYKQTLDEFKKSLSNLVASDSNGKPVVFFIDELDRCNPHYAVKVLERVKHLFEVPNIAFIIAVNEEQLQYAVQGFYGSDKINGKEYLRRFFDMNITLPKPNMSNYVRVLYDIHKFDYYFSEKQNSNNNESEVFLNFASDLLVGGNINLRLANKIFAYTRLVLCNYNYGASIDSDTFLLLCYLKVCHASIFDKIKKCEYDIQELVDILETTIPQGVFSNEIDPFTPRHTAFAIAGLISFYRYNEYRLDRFPNFIGTESADNNVKTYPISVRYLDSTILNEALDFCDKKNIYKYGLNTIISKIEIGTNLNL